MIFGDVVLIEFPHTSTEKTKKRPALVVVDPDDGDILLARICSKSFGSNYETTVQSWGNAGLLLPSFVRLHKLATLQKSMIYKHLGKLENEDLQQIRSKLKEMFENLA